MILIWILLLGFAMFITTRWVVRVVIYGKGFFFPNWARADRMLREKHSVSAHYENSFWWKASYYLGILMIIGLIAAVRYIIMM